MEYKTLRANIQKWLYWKNDKSLDVLAASSLSKESFTDRQVEQHGIDLALSHTLTKKRILNVLLNRLADSENTWIKASQLLTNAATSNNHITATGELLLDNFYLIEEQILLIKSQIVKGYEKNLPQLASDVLQGCPRVYDIALQIIQLGKGYWDLERLTHYVQAYQSITKLSLSELWALPIMLRLALIESISVVSAQIASNNRTHNFKQQTANQTTVSNGMASLRRLVELDWRKFVETMSVVEHILQEDPTATYNYMDFNTRDHYRHVVEDLARASLRSELEVAEAAIRLAKMEADSTVKDGSNNSDRARRSHVGFYLIDKGLHKLKQTLGIRCSLWKKILHWVSKGSLLFYLGFIILIVSGITGSLVVTASKNGVTGWLILFGIVIAISISQLVVAFLNWSVMLFSKPQPLPRMDFTREIPAQFRTLIVVPSIFGSIAEVETLIEALEVRYLGNRDNHLHFALLTDFRDAPQQHMPNDAVLLAVARERITALNVLYRRGDEDIFFLLHRPRRWNARDEVWMGYERKRGKLNDLNSLLRGNVRKNFSLIIGQTAVLSQVKYVITLDSDTQLPRESARQLIGAMAHPLNRPSYDALTERIVAGYGILQPRMASALPDHGPSRYLSLSGSELGIDPYTRTVSNIYQDLFNEGSFIGKGIYDVDLFHQILGHRFPENLILSHDLLEGCYLRSGFLSDVTLYENSPGNYLVDVRRRSRWIRGDWQLVGWLLPRVLCSQRGRIHNPLSGLSKWKLLDNLRRSLVALSLIVLITLDLTVLPVTYFSFGIIPSILLLPAFSAIFLELIRKPKNISLSQHLVSIKENVLRRFNQTIWYISSLPHEAWYSLEAIMRVCWRRIISHRYLLEWAPSDQVSYNFHDTLAQWMTKMWMGPISALSVAVILIVQNRSESLLFAAPLLILWVASPLLGRWLSRPLQRPKVKLELAQIRFLHIMARKTWGFFDTFITAKDNWLPPDNYQEFPKEVLNHRTSPTNMGLALLANLSAYDFGYINGKKLLERTAKTLQTMSVLERYRGHFYNWYDTKTLKPLQPRFVSTVDGGNLAGHLLTLRQGLLALTDDPILKMVYLDGLTDTFGVLEEVVRVPFPEVFTRFRQLLVNARSSFHTWSGALRSCDELHSAAEQIAALWPDSAVIPASLYEWSQKLLFECCALQNELMFFSEMSSELNADTTLRDIAMSSESHIQIKQVAVERVALIEVLAGQALELAQMDVGFLYNETSRLMTIGFNVDEKRRDGSDYDLLSSEARLANFVAIAQSQVPQESWFALGRLQVMSKVGPLMMSWGGSMFEYLMPLLVMPSYPETLLDHVCKGVVNRHIDYGKQRGVPWGISESGFNAVDADSNYLYRAFGVPELGLKRDLDEDLVVAPYATVMALMVAPEEACLNLERLVAQGAVGRFGFYEAIDFTSTRLPYNTSSVLVKSFMVHHQAMSFLAFSHLLHNQPMQRRFVADPLLRATLLLLQERIPKPVASYFQKPQASNIPLASSQLEAPAGILNESV